jgi:hypothetical protein
MSHAGKVCLSVELPLAGEGFPSPAELKARNAIIDSLDQQRIGRFVGAGGGMGVMDFSYVVENEQQARDAIAAAIKRRLPDAAFTIEAGSASEIELDEADDGRPAQVNWGMLIAGLLAVAVGLLLIFRGCSSLIG